MIRHSWNMIAPINKQLGENSKQQNATDFTCDEISRIDYSFTPKMPAILLDKTIHTPDITSLEPAVLEIDGPREGWFLDPGIYQTKSNVWVEIPEDKAGWVIQRSSLNRNGVMVMGSLYDSGYNGTINSTIYVFNQNGIFIEKGARIGQFVLADAEALGQYQGQYQSEKRTKDG